jgi:RND family efflux transporter MFP subunit
MTQEDVHADHAPAHRRRIPLVLGGLTFVALALGALLVSRASGDVDRTPLASQPKGVTVVAAHAARYRGARRYVGTVEPWLEAHVGPQLISAYVDTVLVRPGDVVRKGQVLATLDCRNASASSRAVAMQARAIQTEQEALAHEAARVAALKEGGFASANEIENREASSASKQAALLETQAKLQRASLEVGDCVLRAPFAGEVAARLGDPGAFVRPGTEVATVVDRGTVRVVADVPEADFDVVRPDTAVRIHALATDRRLEAKVARRSPAADASTRTIRVEIDVPDPERALPVATTAELEVDVGAPVEATEIPLVAASVRGAKATVFRVEGAVVRKAVYAVVGERAGSLFLEAKLAPQSQVVTEGRGLLVDGDRVEAKLEGAR